MRRTQTQNIPAPTYGTGFTLIELLIVIAILALLMSILLPALGHAKAIARKVTCQSNLREIGKAWNVYLDENNEFFYQGVNVNHSFGGWKGIGGYSSIRPLNKQLSLPVEGAAEVNAKMFCCPADSGGIFNRPPELKAFQYFGNSYQTNIFLIGPDQTGVPTDARMQLHQEMNKHLTRLKRTAVAYPDRLLLVGDNGWMNQWDPMKPFMPTWHEEAHKFNVAFLDSHVKYLKIRKGFYINPKKGEDYRILPFQELDRIAYQVQEEIIPPEEIPVDNP